MRFDDFLNLCDQLGRRELPGIAAHETLLPHGAGERLQAYKNDPEPRLSGVAATIYPKGNEAHILLIERQVYEGVHSAQISFPGGKAEQGDADLLATALREMEEEVGLDRTLPVLVREMTRVYIPPSRFLVQPYLFYVPALPHLVKDEREVRSVIELPVAHLLDEKSIVQGKIKMSNGVAIKSPYFEYMNHKIWGATAMMLSELKTILTY